MANSERNWVLADGVSAVVDQAVVLANDPTGEKCGEAAILSFCDRTADFDFAFVKWYSDEKVERVLLDDLQVAPLNPTEESDFDLDAAEFRDYYSGN